MWIGYGCFQASSSAETSERRAHVGIILRVPFVTDSNWNRLPTCRRKCGSRGLQLVQVQSVRVHSTGADSLGGPGRAPHSCSLFK